MGSAVSAGAIADVLCNPMFVVRTRLQTEAVHTMYDHPDNNSKKNNTIVQTIQQLYKEGGLLTFWRGMTANLLGLTHVAVQFPVYEQLKTSLRQHRCAGMDPGGKSIFSPDVTDRSMGGDTVIDLLVASGLSKMTASLLTYPHETIRSRMMDVRTTRTISFVQTCRSIYAADGIVGFYAGLSVSLIRVIPNTMLTFLVYETTLPWVQHQLFP